MRRRNRKTEELPNAHTDNATLDSELILLSKRQVDARSDRRRSHGMGGYPALGLKPEGLPSVGGQLITQLADLDLNADIRMTDYVVLTVELPLWQVIALDSFGNMNGALIALLNENLDNRAGDPAYLARLNALILKEAQDEQVRGYNSVQES